MRTALVVVDAQCDMFDPASAVAEADVMLSRLRDLLRRARAAGAPVVLVRNRGAAGEPDEPGTPGFELHPDLERAAGDLVLDKTTPDAFASTPLADTLAARGVDHVVVAGMQSEYCIRETVLGAVRHGLRVTLVADAHSTYPDSSRAAAAIRADVNAELAWQAALDTADAVRFAPQSATERP